MADTPPTLAEMIRRERRELVEDLSRLGHDWAIEDYKTQRGWLIRLRDAGLIAEQLVGDGELGALVEMHRLVRARIKGKSS